MIIFTKHLDIKLLQWYIIVSNSLKLFIYMMRSTKLLYYILLTLMLSGCYPENLCLMPDNFHTTYMNVSSRYDARNIIGEEDDQVAPWLRAEGLTNGQPLVVIVKNWNKKDHYNIPGQVSAWSPWYGQAEGGFNKLNEIPHSLTQYCEYDGDMCHTTAEPNVKNAPCIMTGGKGLYGLIMKPEARHPNTNRFTMENPNGYNFHLGEDRSDADVKLYDININTAKLEEANGVYLDYMKFKDSLDNPVNYLDSPVYFKIYDTYYNDNAGMYQLMIKSGLSYESKGIIFDFIHVFKTTLFGVKKQTSFDTSASEATKEMVNSIGSKEVSGLAEYGVKLVRGLYTKDNNPQDFEGKIPAMFKNVVKDPRFQNTVWSITILFLILTAMSYLIGMTSMSQGLLIKTLIKIAVINQLLSSEGSWTFFNDHFFAMFIYGIDSIIGTIMGGIVGAETNGLYIYDDLFRTLLGEEVFKKILALIFSDNSADIMSGILFAVIFYTTVVFLFIAVGKAVITYLIAMTTIGLLILIFPIIITFFLFSTTSDIYENWFKLLASYSLQPILLMAGIGLFSTVIIEDVYLQLGFKACFYPKTFVELPMNENIRFRIWQPIYVDEEDDFKANILVPRSFTKDDGTFCKPYECAAERYVNYPFIEPDNDKHMEVLKNFYKHSFAQPKLMLELVLVIYLMRKFVGYTDELARKLASTQKSEADIDSMRSGMTSNFGKIAAAGGTAAVAIPATVAKTGANATKNFVKLSERAAEKSAGAAVRGTARGAVKSLEGAKSALTGAAKGVGKAGSGAANLGARGFSKAAPKQSGKLGIGEKYTQSRINKLGDSADKKAASMNKFSQKAENSSGIKKKFYNLRANHAKSGYADKSSDKQYLDSELKAGQKANEASRAAGKLNTKESLEKASKAASSVKDSARSVREGAAGAKQSLDNQYASLKEKAQSAKQSISDGKQGVEGKIASAKQSIQDKKQAYLKKTQVQAGDSKTAKLAKRAARPVTKPLEMAGSGVKNTAQAAAKPITVPTKLAYSSVKDTASNLTTKTSVSSMGKDVGGTIKQTIGETGSIVKGSFKSSVSTFKNVSKLIDKGPEKLIKGKWEEMQRQQRMAKEAFDREDKRIKKEKWLAREREKDEVLAGEVDKVRQRAKEQGGGKSVDPNTYHFGQTVAANSEGGANITPNNSQNPGVPLESESRGVDLNGAPLGSPYLGSEAREAPSDISKEDPKVRERVEKEGISVDQARKEAETEETPSDKEVKDQLQGKLATELEGKNESSSQESQKESESKQVTNYVRSSYRADFERDKELQKNKEEKQAKIEANRPKPKPKQKGKSPQVTNYVKATYTRAFSGKGGSSSGESGNSGGSGSSSGSSGSSSGGSGGGSSSGNNGGGSSSGGSGGGSSSGSSK